MVAGDIRPNIGQRVLTDAAQVGRGDGNVENARRPDHVAEIDKARARMRNQDVFGIGIAMDHLRR